MSSPPTPTKHDPTPPPPVTAGSPTPPPVVSATPPATSISPTPRSPISTTLTNARPQSMQLPSPAPPSSNPKVAELQLMFPTVDPGVIEMILESVGGSQDRAIEQLLSMTDENFRPDELASVRQEESSQLDLDAEFARTLQLQEDEQARQARFNPPPPGQRGGQLPYQPRVRNRPRQAGQQDVFDHDGDGGAAGGDQALHDRYAWQPQEGQPGGMLNMEDKLAKAAEVGKQTFNSFLTKAKGAYADFQARQAQNTKAGPQMSNWGDRPQNESWREPPPTNVPGGGRGGEQNRGSRGLWGDSESYSRSESFSSQSTSISQPVTSQPQAARPSPGRWQPSDAYDDPLPPARTTSGTRIDVAGGRRSPAGAASPPEKGKIDPAKLGFLPKKKVDLLSTANPVTPQTNKSLPPIATPNPMDDDDDEDFNPSLPPAEPSALSRLPKTPPATSPYKLDDSDDELEYTRNPFDEK